MHPREIGDSRVTLSTYAKRGLSMEHCRYDISYMYLSIYQSGFNGLQGGRSSRGV